MKHIVLSVFAITTLMAGPLMAQSPAQPGTMGQDGSSMPMMQGGSQGCIKPMTGMAQHVKGRIAFMRTELKITGEQLPQWNVFADAMRANARRMTEMHGMMGQGASPSAPERLDHMEKMMAGMLEAMRSTKAALTPLFSMLS
jgi:hypothetical protein